MVNIKKHHKPSADDLLQEALCLKRERNNMKHCMELKTFSYSNSFIAHTQIGSMQRDIFRHCDCFMRLFVSLYIMRLYAHHKRILSGFLRALGTVKLS